MNPYITERIDRYNALRAEIEAVQTRAAAEHRDITEDELVQIRAAGDEAAALATEVTPYMEDHARANGVAALAAQLGHGDQAVATGFGGADPYAGLGATEQVPNLMPTRAQVTELYRAVDEQTTRRIDVQHTRATVVTADTGLGVVTMSTAGLREPRRISSAAGLGVQRVQGIEGVSFPVFGAGAAVITAENAAKSVYDAVNPGTATPQVIAVWTDASRQALMSVSSFEARLRSKHAALIAKREDLLLVATVLGTTGIQTYAGGANPYAESLLNAAALVLASDVAAEPNMAVINPADVALVFGTPTGKSGETPEAALRLSLHGMAVYVSTAITAGTALVGAWSASSRFIVGMTPTVLIDSMSGLKTNTVTILMEEAVALAVDEPTGFVSVDFVTP